MPTAMSVVSTAYSRNNGAAAAKESPASMLAAMILLAGAATVLAVAPGITGSGLSRAVAQAGPGARGPDGSVVLTLRVTSRAGLRSWVLGFLDHAEVLSPPAERDALISWLEQCAELYGSPRR